jgi:hypothetical protein
VTRRARTAAGIGAILVALAMVAAAVTALPTAAGAAAPRPRPSRTASSSAADSGSPAAALVVVIAATVRTFPHPTRPHLSSSAALHRSAEHAFRAAPLAGHPTVLLLVLVVAARGPRAPPCNAAATDRFAVAGGDPVNEGDPSGLRGTPLPACVSGNALASPANCIQEELYQANGGRGFGPVPPLPTGTTRTIAGCPDDPGVAFSATLNLPTIAIPGPMPLSISTDLTVSGADAPVTVDLNMDGSFDIAASGASAEISSEGTIDSLSAEVPGGSFGVSGEGLSVTRSLSASVSSDSVEADMTVTLHPFDWNPPPSDITPAEVLGGIGIIGIVIWWAAKPLCAFTGPFAGVCAVAA